MAVGNAKNEDNVIIRRYESVTPDDSNDITAGAIGLRIGGTAGNIVFTDEGGDVTLAVTAYEFIPCTTVSRVKSTGTTATPIHAVY